MTHQREVILQAVLESHDHPTADAIYEVVREKLPKISMGTVYRNLDILASCGFVKRLGSNHHQMRFDGNIHDHYHLTCIRCGAIEDVPLQTSDGAFDTLEKALGNLTKHGIFGHHLDFFGLCTCCRNELKESSEQYLSTYLQGGIK